MLAFSFFKKHHEIYNKIAPDNPAQFCF